MDLCSGQRQPSRTGPTQQPSCRAISGAARRPYPPATLGGRADIGAFEAQTGTIVTTELDTDDPFDFETSLAEAIDYANAHAGPDTIRFDRALSGRTITLHVALPGLTGELTIEGLGADRLTVARSLAKNTPAFSVFTVAISANVEISGLTISHGLADYGGGIASFGDLELSAVSVDDNRAHKGGGGIANLGTLNVRNSTISGNRSDQYGGGISTGGAGSTAIQASIVNSTLSGNTASYSGGGVANFAGSQLTRQVDITHATLSGNSQAGGGSDLYNEGPAAYISNSIFNPATGTSLFSPSGWVSCADTTCSPMTARGGM